MLQVKIPYTEVTLRLVKNDITESHCDAIVNASNEDLELRPAGVSGSIMRQGAVFSLFSNFDVCLEARWMCAASVIPVYVCFIWCILSIR